MPHRFDPTILREYDIRGIVGRSLSTADARAIGRAYARTLAAAGGRRAAVGYDGRLTSPDLEGALVDGLASEGVDVVRIGRGPTPMLYYAAATLGVDGGVMVTGSHNPPEYNGFKFVLGGKAFYGAAIRALADIALTLGAAQSTRGRVEVRESATPMSSGWRATTTVSRALTVAWARETAPPGMSCSADRPATGPAYFAERRNRRQLPSAPSRSDRAGEPGAIAAGGGPASTAI